MQQNKNLCLHWRYCVTCVGSAPAGTTVASTTATAVAAVAAVLVVLGLGIAVAPASVPGLTLPAAAHPAAMGMDMSMR